MCHLHSHYSQHWISVAFERRVTYTYWRRGLHDWFLRDPRCHGHSIRSKTSNHQKIIPSSKSDVTIFGLFHLILPWVPAFSINPMYQNAALRSNKTSTDIFPVLVFHCISFGTLIRSFCTMMRWKTWLESIKDSNWVEKVAELIKNHFLDNLVEEGKVWDGSVIC